MSVISVLVRPGPGGTTQFLLADKVKNYFSPIRLKELIILLLLGKFIQAGLASNAAILTLLIVSFASDRIGSSSRLSPDIISREVRC